MIEEVDVVVRMAACSIPMGDNEVVRGCHAARELHAQLVDSLEVVEIGHVELIWAERLDVAVDLDLAAVGAGEGLGPSDELLGRFQRTREHRGARRAVALVRLAHSLGAAEQCVAHRVCRRP